MQSDRILPTPSLQRYSCLVTSVSLSLRNLTAYVIFNTPYLGEEASESQPTSNRTGEVTCAIMNDAEINHTCGKEDMKARQA
jgi:hypothetical protein